MTIGFLINTCEPFYRGGYERRTWALARELARQGHDVRVYTSCLRDEVIEGVRFVRFGPLRSFFNERGVRNGWADLLFTLGILRLRRAVRSGELDVLDVCATPFLHLPVVAFIARLRRISVVLTCHEALLASLPAYVRERGNRGRFARRFFTGLLEMIYCWGMDLFPRRLAVSQQTAAAQESEGYPAAAVVEFGLEPEAFSALEPEAKLEGEPARFVFCGRLTPIKNVLETVRTLLSLHTEGEKFRFDIIGEGSERARLEDLVSRAQAQAKIFFHGQVSEEAKRSLLAQSEIFVLSSPREGFSIATLEAMAQGCGAVIVSDPRQPNGALDFVQDGKQGLCIKPGWVPMKQTLRTLLRNPELRLRLRKEAWKMSVRYRVETQARKLAEFYPRVN
jgi:glycosyltransferase involved in cell wall biosynthesis